MVLLSLFFFLSVQDVSVCLSPSGKQESHLSPCHFKRTQQLIYSLNCTNGISTILFVYLFWENCLFPSQTSLQYSNLQIAIAPDDLVCLSYTG